jgi:hypothetical protein
MKAITRHLATLSCRRRETAPKHNVLRTLIWHSESEKMGAFCALRCTLLNRATPTLTTESTTSYRRDYQQ